MKKVTLDHNTIIDLEENRPAAVYVKRLIDLNDQGKIKVRVTAVGGAERRRDRTFAKNIGDFLQKISAAGLGNVEILYPMATLDRSFLGFAVLGGPEGIELETKIHAVLFDGVEHNFQDYCHARGLDSSAAWVASDYQNMRSDVQTLWCHINYGGDIFVTSDKNFHAKKEKLIALGAGSIYTPKEAVEELAKLGL